jgi:hypothetical protein
MSHRVMLYSRCRDVTSSFMDRFNQYRDPMILCLPTHSAVKLRNGWAPTLVQIQAVRDPVVPIIDPMHHRPKAGAEIRWLARTFRTQHPERSNVARACRSSSFDSTECNGRSTALPHKR